MKILYFDCFAGISGDMAVGAMLDLGVPFDALDVNLENIDLKKSNVLKNGISAVKFDVFDKNTHRHADHSHHHVEDIEKIILRAKISETAKKSALQIFNELAKAEGKIHGVSDKKSLHLHEVGALDSIADIICLALCVENLRPDKIIFSPINTGEGTVKCAHGILPVPAPAAAELLKQIPVYSDGTKMELTTPTGAAFARVFADDFGSMPLGKIIKIGYGAGSREIDDKPNVLRALLIESSENKKNELYQIETQIDDMTAETLAPIFNKLLSAGALDVYLTQILMKKQRPGFLLTVLSDFQNKENLEKIILNETTTFGVRSWKISRVCLDRKIEKFNSSLGTVKIKTGQLGNIVKKMPEFDDCLKIAEKLDLPVREVYNKIISEIYN